jgi:hypothetical protein
MMTTHIFLLLFSPSLIYLLFLHSLTSRFHVIETQQDFQLLHSDMQATLLPSSGYICVLTSGEFRYCQQ